MQKSTPLLPASRGFTRASFILLVFCLPSVATSQHLADKALGRKITAILEANKAESAAGVCLVTHDDKVILEQAFGRQENGKAITAKTLFASGSLSEVFTAIAALRLSHANRLLLEDSIQKHIPGVPESHNCILIGELIAHRSGLLEVEIDDGGLKRDTLVDRILTAKDHRGLRYRRRRSRGADDNISGYALYAAIMELRTGKEFEALVSELVFKPCKMRSTRFLDAAFPPERGSGLSPWRYRGHAGVVTSAHDLLAWHRALQSRAFLSPDAHSELDTLSREDPAFKLTTESGPDNKALRIHHRTSVSQSQTQALYSFDPQRNILVLILANAGFDLEAADKQLQAALKSTAVTGSECVGQYKMGTNEILDVAMIDGTLRLRALGQEMSARIKHGRREMPEWPNFYREAHDRAAILFRPLLEKDAESFRRSFHDEAPKGAADRAMKVIAGLESEFGAIEGAQLIGTSSESGSYTWYRVLFGKTAITFEIRWFGREFDQVYRSEQAFPFSVDLERLRTNEFRATVMDGKKQVRIVFTGPKNGPMKTIKLFDPSKTGKKGIAGRRSLRENR